MQAKIANPVMSFKNLRRLVGVLGMLLPLVCFLGGLLLSATSLRPSISAYYYTNVRDAFVGLLVAVGLFLISYKGYQKLDDIVSTVSGVAGLGIAAFPCLAFKGSAAPVGFFQLPPGLSDGLHVACAGLFFVLLAVNSIFIFTMTDSRDRMTDNKKKRNAIYIGCGIVILAAIIAMLILQRLLDPAVVERYGVVFFCETVMLEAFGFSWLVKGETILRD